MSVGSQRALLLAISLLVALAIAELALRTALPPGSYLDPTTDAYWDGVVGDRPLPESADIEADPRLGWRMKRGHRGPAASHDARGFRNTGRRATSPNARRVFLIGDSFTYGLNVSDEQTFAARLETQLGAEVVNAGVNGFGVDQAILMWELEGRPLDPDAVVLGYFTDDFHRSALTRREAAKPSLVPEPDGAGLSYEAPGQLQSRDGLGPLRLVPAFRYAARRVSDRLGRLPVERLERRQALSERLLLRLRDSVEAEGAELLLLVIPHCRYPNDGHYGEWIAPRIVDTASGLGIPAVDFRDMLDPALYEGCHWNAEGHARAAARIAAALRR